MRGLLFAITLFCYFHSLCAQQPPGTEIYLFDLVVTKSNVTVSNPQNITSRKGYDNQPYFHPDKPLIYYSSANEEGRTDIIEYNYLTQYSRNLTNTSEREYSPTVTPDKQFISCIIQRDSGAQDLGKYPIAGGNPVVIINNLTVGYHAWINDRSLLLFVLGDTVTLHRYDIESGKDEIISKKIGRSLHKIPGLNAMCFVHKLSENKWMIKKLHGNDAEIIVETLPGREDLTWTSDGKILMSDGKKLFYYDTHKPSGWKEITLPALPPGTITRLSVNADAGKLALVVGE